MKTKLHIHNLLLIAILALVYTSCKDLPVLDDCNVDTDIIIEPNLDCTASEADPCVKTFRLRDAELLPEGARVTWSLTKGGVEIPLPNPSVLEFEFEFTEAGFDYAANASIVFDFEGCDVSLNKPFIIGVDAPVAFITPSTQQCIVGECEVTFTATVANVDSWTWSIPGDSNDHQNEATVTRSFNERPDTLSIMLTAFNIGDTVSDVIKVFVEPATFIVDGQAAPPSEGKILLVDEQSNGSFTIIGTTGLETYTERISRAGIIEPNSRDEVGIIPDNYTPRDGKNCYSLDNKRFVVGQTVRDNSNNPNTKKEVYLAVFDDTYTPIAEKPLFHENDGNELGQGITTTPDNGYLLCGNKSTISPAQPTGMLFLKLNASFDRTASIVKLENDPFNTAYGIISLAEGYAVIGQALNPDTEQFEGCFFKMDHDFDILDSVNYLGADFLPNEIIKISETDYVIIGNEGSTGIVKGMGSISWEREFGDTWVEKALITSDLRIAVTGYALINGKERPILKTLKLDGSDAAIDKDYPLDTSGRILTIAQTRDNGFVLGGHLNSSTDDDVILIIRTDKNGEVNE